jgi:queuine/archaeosine tRNA-ribosyltransferase
MQRIRDAIEEGTFAQFREKFVAGYVKYEA